MNRVWIVLEGCRYEGSEIRSVHSTHEGALAKAEKLQQRRDGEWIPSKDQNDLWRNGMNYVVVQEWNLE